MDRRTFLAGSGCFLASPLAAEAQQAGKVYRIGYLSPGNRPHGPSRALDAFRDGLREHGFMEGQNVVIEWRYAEAS